MTERVILTRLPCLSMADRTACDELDQTATTRNLCCVKGQLRMSGSLIEKFKRLVIMFAKHNVIEKPRKVAAATGFAGLLDPCARPAKQVTTRLTLKQ
jgi:hypothetical protein